uniref:Uncharacterized protein n=1 Tax=Arundo donax TaxID=35708 RepID=A0A0A8YKU9_ARUDO
MVDIAKSWQLQETYVDSFITQSYRFWKLSTNYLFFNV